VLRGKNPEKETADGEKIQKKADTRIIIV